MDPNFGEKTSLQFTSLEKALSSLDFLYRKLRQTPQPPPPPTHTHTPKKKKNDEIGQQKPIEVTIFSYFIPNKVKFYFIARFNLIPSRKRVTQHRALQAVTSHSISVYKSLMFDRFLVSLGRLWFDITWSLHRASPSFHASLQPPMHTLFGLVAHFSVTLRDVPIQRLRLSF